LARKPTFSSLIRDTRKQRGLSVVEVAERVGVSTASIYMWETDRGRPREDNLSALCKALKLPVRTTKELAVA
jgi:transcriptional regulator with XRE-family HTH domain